MIHHESVKSTNTKTITKNLHDPSWVNQIVQHKNVHDEKSAWSIFRIVPISKHIPEPRTWFHGGRTSTILCPTSFLQGAKHGYHSTVISKIVEACLLNFAIQQINPFAPQSKYCSELHNHSTNQICRQQRSRRHKYQWIKPFAPRSIYCSELINVFGLSTNILLSLSTCSPP